MTVCAHPSPASRPANGVAPHILPEAFQDFAFCELDAAPLHQPGICFNPDCSRDFTPARDWQMYCCLACKQAGTAELRAWGHRMALALLAWRMGKYETRDGAVRDRTAAARRYLSQVQSAWLADRRGPRRARPARGCGMTISAIKGQAGDERAFCVCDSCGAETSIPARHGGNGKWMPGGQPRLHLQSHAAVVDALRKLGWSQIKNRLRYPACEAARLNRKDSIVQLEKAVIMDMQQAAADQGTRQPNRDQKRLIILALEDAYDTAAKRYRGDMTDRNLADQLGDGIMPGWVSELREDFFGPVGNEEVEALRSELAAVAAAQVDLQKALTDLGSRVAALTVRLNTCVGAHDKRVGGKVGA